MAITHVRCGNESATRGAGAKPGTVVVANVVRQGTSRSFDAGKYGAMRQAVLRVLPRQAPGMTLADALADAPTRLSSPTTGRC